MSASNRNRYCKRISLLAYETKTRNNTLVLQNRMKGSVSVTTNFIVITEPDGKKIKVNCKRYQLNQPNVIFLPI